MSLLRSAARRLGLGKYRYWQGTDLQGNNFFERPHPEFPDEWRKNKRYVEYYETKPLSDYNYQSIPVQWSSWLRRTRREPPTLEELQKDYLRQLRLQENVHRLEQEYKAEKLRLAEANQAALLQAPTAAGRPRSTDATTAAVDLKSKAQEGLPADRGGVDEATAAKAPEVARNIGLGQKEDLSASEATARDDASGVATASPEELAERRRKQEEADAAKRRAEFAKANAAPLKAQEKSAQQPEGWAPSAPARRR